jgi:hypothetical protein
MSQYPSLGRNTGRGSHLFFVLLVVLSVWTDVDDCIAACSHVLNMGHSLTMQRAIEDQLRFGKPY